MIECTVAEQIERLNARVIELLQFNNEFEERARQAERAIKALTTPRPIADYHEDLGDVLWWKFPITEPPYVGTPGDCGITVEAHTTTRVISQINQEHDPEPHIERVHLGGWPGYHTHFTALPTPRAP
jgi:hypothetical protein